MYFNLISLFAVIRWHPRTVQMNMNRIEGGRVEEGRKEAVRDSQLSDSTVQEEGGAYTL